MGSRVFEDALAEEEFFRQIERRRETRADFLSRNRDAGERAAGIRQTYPHLTPGVTTALAQGGYGADHPTVTQAATASALTQASKPFGFARIGDVVKSDVRTALVAASTPLELVQTGLRALAHSAGQAAEKGRPIVGIPGEFGAALEQAGTPTGILALAELSEGQPVDLGTGFLPRGEIIERHAEEVRQLEFAGAPISTGRLLAYSITEPGTRPYSILSGLVDLAFALGADPVGAGLGTASKFRQAAKTFVATPELAPTFNRIAQNAGLISATRKTIGPAEKVEAWLSREGREVVEFLTKEKNFAKARTITNGKIPSDVLIRTIDADDPNQVRQILSEALGTRIRERPGLARFPEVKRSLESVRLLHQMPGQYIDLNDLDRSVETLNRFMRNANLPTDLIEESLEAMARTTTRNQRFRVLTDTLENVSQELGLIKGVEPGAAKKLTRIWTNYHEDMAKYFVNEIGENVAVPGAVIDGFGKALPTPHLFTELLARTVPLPDAREIRRVASSLRNVWANPLVEIGTSALDVVLQQAWKPLVLLRGAWTVRVIGEEQVRMGASGLDSVISHPLSWLAYVTGKKGALDVTGKNFDEVSKVAAELDEFARAMSRGTAGFRDRGLIRTKNKVLVRRGDEHFARSWADEVMQLRSDPIAQRVAGGLLEGDGVTTKFPRTSLEAVKEWFWSGTGKAFRGEMAEASGKRVFLARAGADEYIDSVLRRVQIKTGGDGSLIDAIATGKLNGKLVQEISKLEKGLGKTASNDFIKTLGRLADEGIGPEIVKGDQFLVLRTKGAKVAQGWDRAVESMFSALMSNPTNKLSRSPAFKQFYWKRVRELAGFMDDATKKQVIEAATVAKLGKSQIVDIRRAVRTGTGNLTLKEADLVSKGFALDSVKSLLYDLSERSQFFDIARHIFPFGEAWKEVLTRWAKIGFEQPQVIRRGQQIITGGEGAGFFYPDPQSGEEVFAYPGSEFLTRAMFKVPVRLQGSLKGLNILGNVIPGFGPAAQIPAGWLLPDKPAFDGIRKMLLPYGKADLSRGFLESQLPAYMKKLLTAATAPESDRQFGNTVMDVAAYLLSTGEYPADSEEDMRALLEDAKSRARGLFLVRGMVQFVAPSAPSPEFYAQDKDGRLVFAETLAREYRRMLDENPDTAFADFLEKYGEGAFLLTQPASRALIPAVPVTREGMDWVRDNPGIAKDYPNAYGFFAPQGELFDLNAFSRQFETGEREPLTPEQAVKLANHRVASMLYQQAKDQVGDSPTKEDEEWLSDLRTALREDYPGFQDFAGLSEKVKPERVIEELRKAANDPRLRDTEQAEAVRLYFEARDRAQTEAEGLEVKGFQSAKRTRHLREWLREVADALIEDYPTFAPIWEQGFSRELPRETFEEEEAA